MAIVCAILALILAFAAWNSQTRGTRVWLGCWAVFNLAVSVHMIASGFDHRWTLLPPEADEEPSYHR